MAWSKESRHKRGYGSAWDKLREQVLRRDGYLCLTCQRAGRLTVAREVDHVVSKANWLKRHGSLAGCDDPANLESICAADHHRKTIEETGKTFTPRVRIGPDGYPIQDAPGRR